MSAVPAKTERPRLETPGFISSRSTPPQPATTPTPSTEFSALQAGSGNATLAAAATGGSLAAFPSLLPLQSTLGNAAASRAIEEMRSPGTTPSGIGEMAELPFGEQQAIPPSGDVGHTAEAGKLSDDLAGGTYTGTPEGERNEAAGARKAENTLDSGVPAEAGPEVKHDDKPIVATPERKTSELATAKPVGGSELQEAQKQVGPGVAPAPPEGKMEGTGPSLPAPPTFPAPALAPIELPDPLLLAPPDPTLRPKRYDPALARAEVMMMLGQLAAAAERKKGPVRANADAIKEQIAKNGLDQKTAALRLVSQTRLNIAGEIKQAKAAVAAHAKSYKAVAQAQAIAAWLQLVTAGTTQAGAIEQSKKSHQDAARKVVSDKQGETRQFGESEGKRGREAVEAQARDALARGAKKAASYRSDDPERDQVQANAVQNIANATAAELLKPAASIEAKAIEQGNQLADGFAGAADKAVAAIEEQALQIAQQVVGAVPTQLATFQGIGAATGEAIDNFAASIVAELAGVERESNRQLHSVGVSLTEQIDGAVATVHGSVDQQVVALEESLDRIVERTSATAMAAQRPDPEGLRKALVTVDGMLDDACDGFYDGLYEMEDGAAQTFEDAITVASTDLAQVETSTSGSLARITAATVDGMQALIDKQEEETGKFITKWTEGLASAQKEVDAKWDSIVSGVGDKINEELNKGKPAITKGVDDSVAKNKKPLDELDEKMEEAAEQAAYKYDHPIRYKLKHVLFGVLKALAALVIIVALAIVAIVAIVVGIISGTVWLIVAGVILLVAVVGYVLYGIVSGIVRRIQSANTIFDGIRGFFIGILDITGIPNIVEGLTEQDMVNGNTLTVEDAGERLGGGIVALLTIIIPFAKGLKGMRGAPRVPIEVAPEIRVGPELPGPRVEVPKVEVPTTEVPKVEVPTTEVPKTEAPKTEAPKIEEPKVEKPKAEELKVEKPKVEEPKVEKPKAEGPKVEEPTTEKPKAEEKAPDEKAAEEQKAASEEVTEKVESEEGVAEEKQDTGHRVKDSATTLEDVKELKRERPRKTKPPEEVKQPWEKKLWKDYYKYYQERVAQIEREIREGKKPSDPPPLTWEAYRSFRGRFYRGMEFQAKTTGTLKGLLKKFKVEEEVSVESKLKEQINEARRQAREAGDKEATRPAPDRADQLAFDKKQLKDFESGKRAEPPEGTAFSDKSRNPADYPSPKAFLEQVGRDAAETVEKYGGDVKIKSDKFGPKLVDRTVQIKRLFQIFDGELIRDAKLREAIKQEVDAASFGKVEAVFSDELPTRFGE